MDDEDRSVREEKPIVSLGEIAKYLSLNSEKAAARVLKKYKVPMFYIGNCVAVYPSTLKKSLEGIKLSVNGRKNTLE